MQSCSPCIGVSACCAHRWTTLTFPVTILVLVAHTDHRSSTRPRLVPLRVVLTDGRSCTFLTLMFLTLVFTDGRSFAGYSEGLLLVVLALFVFLFLKPRTELAVIPSFAVLTGPKGFVADMLLFQMFNFFI